jgi:mannose-6-phosphate isomerase
MFDYGRPRELHLEAGLAVMKTKTNAGKIAPRTMDGFVRLIEQQYFIVDRFELEPGEVLVPIAGVGCLVSLCGEGVVIAPGEEESAAGMTFARCIAPA